MTQTIGTRKRLNDSLPDVATVQGDVMLGDATRRQFTLTLDRVRAIAADNTALQESRDDARRIQRILEAFDLDQPSQAGAEPHVPVSLRNEWQMLKAVVLTVDTPLGQVRQAARTMRQAEALGRALPPVPVAEAHDDETSGDYAQEPSSPEPIATPRRATFKISNYDEAVRVAGKRGAPAAIDLGVLVTFFMVSSSVGEGIGIILFPSAGGFGLLNAAVLTVIGFSYISQSGTRRHQMIEDALSEIESREASE